jgi:phospholipase/carboxylesterase
VSGPPLETVEVEPGRAADAAVILMHGLGADGHDFESLVPELRLPDPSAVRWVFPHAPVRPVTINGRQRMRAWYDIVAIDHRVPEDASGIRSSAEAIRDLVRRERARGIAADRIVLAGFSQGGAMALFTGLREEERLAGVLGLSCYLPLAATLGNEAHPANAAVSVFMAHGSFDPVVPIALGEGSRDLLRSLGYEVDWHTYPMAHAVATPEIGDVRRWLLGVLPRRG